jgi:cyclopropane fatty-acyl-phospholipid synthase-like methyltransferase
VPALLQNYRELFRRISTWLAPEGLLFFHIFVHARGLPYHYEVRVPSCFPSMGGIASTAQNALHWL